jgi:predicted small lipoprotein YifL
MRVVLRMSAIVAALTLAAAALGGCGQRGPLYMPNVPPLPTKPSDQTESLPSNVKPDAQTGAIGAASDTSSTPLSLSPDSQLSTTPSAAKPASSPASGSSQDQ